MTIGSSSILRRVVGVGIAASAAVLLTAWFPASLKPAPATTEVSVDRILVAQAERPVSYSEAQATRGKKKYEADCAECHGDDLKGGLLGGPVLRGPSFDEKYADGAPAGALFDVMVGTMPPSSPGRYAPAIYADLMAYILKVNGYKDGMDLPANSDALYELVMQK
ncbi:c-type cytochrome [Devosia sp. MC1541]|uniref:c-type cytochrome n=1 Tax=Devosia sp. MC1541 TaxID=2725264 RepID=UPI00145E4D9C|nr:c-type cytochrome [Devosia sp. MC1541]